MSDKKNLVFNHETCELLGSKAVLKVVEKAINEAIEKRGKPKHVYVSEGNRISIICSDEDDEIENKNVSRRTVWMLISGLLAAVWLIILPFLGFTFYCLLYF